MPEATREQLIETLEQIALLLELKGENPFKIRAYRTGADTVRTYSGDIVRLAADNSLAGIKGIGEALRSKLHELASTGKLGFFENLRAEFPETIFELFDLQGLGAKKIASLHSELGVSSIADLQRACESGEASKLAGFGEKTVANLLEAIQSRAQYAESFRADQAAPAVEDILEYLRGHPATSRAEVAGSFRRGKETVHDLDFLVATKKPEAL
ncbi:MAG: histidinol-phosphatase, partial [Verrucomicrobiaceae bacterium]